MSADEIPDAEDFATPKELLSEELYEFDHKYEGWHNPILSGFSLI